MLQAVFDLGSFLGELIYDRPIDVFDFTGDTGVWFNVGLSRLAWGRIRGFGTEFVGLENPTASLATPPFDAAWYRPPPYHIATPDGWAAEGFHAHPLVIIP